MPTKREYLPLQAGLVADMFSLESQQGKGAQGFFDFKNFDIFYNGKITTSPPNQNYFTSRIFPPPFPPPQSGHQFYETNGWNFITGDQEDLITEYGEYGLSDGNGIRNLLTNRAYFLNQFPISHELVESYLDTYSSPSVYDWTQLNGFRIDLNELKRNHYVDVPNDFNTNHFTLLRPATNSLDLPAWRELVRGGILSVSYQGQYDALPNPNNWIQSVPYTILDVEQVTTPVPALRYYLATSRRDILNQFPTSPPNGNPFFPEFPDRVRISFCVFHSQYAYKVKLNYELRQRTIVSAVDAAGAIRINQSSISSPLFPKQSNPVSGSNQSTAGKLYIGSAPNMMVFRTAPKNMYYLTDYLGYNDTTNVKTVQSFPPNTPAFDNSFFVSQAANPLGYRKYFYQKEDPIWNKTEAETPDCNQGVSVQFSKQDYNLPQFIGTNFATRQQVSFRFLFHIATREHVNGGSYFSGFHTDVQIRGYLNSGVPLAPASVGQFHNTSVSTVITNIKNGLVNLFGGAPADYSVALRQSEQTANNSTFSVPGFRQGVRLEFYTIDIGFLNPIPDGTSIDFFGINLQRFRNPNYNFSGGGVGIGYNPEAFVSFYFDSELPNQNPRFISALGAISDTETNYWHQGLADVNALYAVAVTAVYDGYEESEPIASFYTKGEFAISQQAAGNPETINFRSILIEATINVDPAVSSKRLSYFKVYCGKIPIPVSGTPIRTSLSFTSGIQEQVGFDFDPRTIDFLQWVGVVIVDEAYAQQFDAGYYSAEVQTGTLQGASYYYSPKVAGQPVILGGVPIGGGSYSWLGGSNPRLNAYYPSEQLPTFISGGWTAAPTKLFPQSEAAGVTISFRITGRMFQLGQVVFNETRTADNYLSTTNQIPNGAANFEFGLIGIVPNRAIRYVSLPIGTGSVVNPNATLQENTGRLVKPETEKVFIRDTMSYGIDTTLAGRRHIARILDESGVRVIVEGIVARTSIGIGGTMPSFFEGNISLAQGVQQIETKQSGDIVSLIANSYNDFSDQVRLVVIQERSSKLMSIAGEGNPLRLMQELPNVASPFFRSAILTPQGVVAVTPDGLYLINDANVTPLSVPIDTLWKRRFDRTRTNSGETVRNLSTQQSPIVNILYDPARKVVYIANGWSSYCYYLETKQFTELYDENDSVVSSFINKDRFPAFLILSSFPAKGRKDIVVKQKRHIYDAREAIRTPLTDVLNTQTSAKFRSSLIVAPEGFVYDLTKFNLDLSVIVGELPFSFDPTATIRFYESNQGDSFNSVEPNISATRFEFRQGVVFYDQTFVIGAANEVRRIERALPRRRVKRFYVEVELSHYPMTIENFSYEFNLFSRRREEGLNPRV
jgi:hypothetical protein